MNQDRDPTSPDPGSDPRPGSAHARDPETAAGGSGAGAGAGGPGSGVGGAAAPPPRTGGGRGLFGCLGCVGALFVVVILVPVVLVGTAWFMLPRIVSPADTEWVMVDPDTERAQALKEGLEEDLRRLDGGERTVIELTEEELNQLLATALVHGFADRSSPGGAVGEPSGSRGEPPQARFRITDDVLHLDARVTLPDHAEQVPARLRGRPVGMELGLIPRATGDAIALRVRDVRIGRIPLPLGFAMNLLAGTEAGGEIPFFDRETGELRIGVAQLGPAAEGMTLHDLSVRGGSLRLDVSR